MQANETWFHLIPGVSEATTKLQHAVGGGWLGADHASSASMHHVVMGLFVMGFVVVLGMKYKGALAKAGDGGVIPARTFGARALVEIICDAALGMMAGIMGEKQAWVAALVISSLTFSLAHHLGPSGEAFEFAAFVYRALAGIMFALIYQAAGGKWLSRKA